jgi:hypothetical protein
MPDPLLILGALARRLRRPRLPLSVRIACMTNEEVDRL